VQSILLQRPAAMCPEQPFAVQPKLRRVVNVALTFKACPPPRHCNQVLVSNHLAARTGNIASVLWDFHFFQRPCPEFTDGPHHFAGATSFRSWKVKSLASTN